MVYIPQNARNYSELTKMLVRLGLCRVERVVELYNSAPKPLANLLPALAAVELGSPVMSTTATLFSITLLMTVSLIFRASSAQFKLIHIVIFLFDLFNSTIYIIKAYSIFLAVSITRRFQSVDH